MKKLLTIILISLIAQSTFAADIIGRVTLASCGQNNGAIELSINGGVPNYSFIWTGVAGFTSTAQNISGLAVGNYQVEVTDALCGKATLSFTVNNTGINLKSRISGVCGTNSDGMIEVTGIDGVAPYIYKWSNGANGNLLLGLAKGTYTVTVTDAKNCSSSQSFEIKDRISTITPTAKNGCGDEKGSITLTVEAQANNLTYQWQGENTGFSATTKNISNLSTDRYRVTVSSGCPRPYVSDWVSITNSALDVTVSTYPKNGNVGGSVTIQLAGAAPLSYSFDSQSFVQGTFGTIGNLAGGTYSLVVRNGAGCTKQLNVTIYDCDNLETEKVFEIFPEITALCPFTVKYDYKGKDMKGFKKQIIPHTVTLVPHKNGIDKVAKITQSACIKLTVEDAFCGKPTGTVLAEKCVVPTCDFDFRNASTSCVAKMLYVDTVPNIKVCRPVTYEWSHSQNNSASVPFTIGAGANKTSVTVTDANGCAVVKSFDFDPLEGSIVANLCEGEGKACISFNTANKSNPNYSFKYLSATGIKTTSDPNICNLATGRYTITVTDGGGCTSSKDFDVPNSSGKLEAVYDIKPAQTNTSHDGTINFTIVSGLANFTYTLSNFKDFSSSESNISNPSHSATGLSAGTYYLSIKDANGCNKTYIIELYYCEFQVPNTRKEFVVTPLNEVLNYQCTNSNLNASFIFNEQNKTITATVQGAPTINCSLYGVGLPVNRQLSQAKSIIIFPNIENGRYYFEMTEQNRCNRVYSLDIKDLVLGTTVVNVNDAVWKPNAAIKHINAFCKEGSITLKPYVAGFNKAVTYLWKYPDNTTSNKKNLTNLTASGDYKLTITDPDCGKVTEHIFKLNATPNQELKYTVENICLAGGTGCVTFDMAPFAAYAPFVFEWKKGNTTFPKSDLPKICNLDAGTYTFLIWNKDSCVVTKTIEVKSSNLTMNFVYTTTNTTNCASAKGGLSVTTLTTANGTAPVIFSWFQGNALIAQGNPPPFNIGGLLEAGDYKVVATDANGCSVSKPFIIGVKDDISVSFSDITAPCPNGTNGIVKATASPKLTNGAFYTYTWGAPINLTESNVASSRVQGLKSGTYILTVSTNGGKCQKVVSYTLQAKTFTSADIKATIKNACKGKSNGSISLTTESTGTAFTWASPPINASMSNQAIQLGLPAATNYQVSVTNSCGQTAVALFEVKEVGSFSLMTVTDTKCRTEVKGNFVNAQAPIKYKWANGLVTNSLADNPSIGSATQYSVTATDANGCTGAGTVGEVPTWEIIKLKACAGATGEFNVHIHNPKNDPVAVNVLLGQNITPQSLKSDPNAHHWSRTDQIKGLNAGIEIPVDITIGTCKTREVVILDTMPTTKVFAFAVTDTTDPKAGLCFYKQYCTPVDYLKDAKNKFVLFEKPGYYDIIDCKGKLLCPNLEGTNSPINYPTAVKDQNFWRKTTSGEFVAFLKNEIATNPDPFLVGNAKLLIENEYAEIKATEGNYAFCIKNDSIDCFRANRDGKITNCDSSRNHNCARPIGLCRHIIWCPKDYNKKGIEWSVSVSLSVLVDSDKPIPGSQPGCWSYKCGSVMKEDCPKTFNGIKPEPDVTAHNCNYTTQLGASLYLGWSELKTNINTKNRFIGSDLDNFLEDNINNPKVNCAKVSYCKNDFKMNEYPDFSKIICGKSSKLDKNRCEIYSSGSGSSGYMYCKYKDSKEEDLYIILSNTNNLWRSGNENDMKIVGISDNIATKFSSFAQIKDMDEYYLANGIYQAEQENYYQNYTSYTSNTNEPFSIEKSELVVDDLNESIQVNVSKLANKRLYTLDFNQELGNSWTKYIEGDSLEIVKLRKSNYQIAIAGFFKGSLYYNLSELTKKDNYTAFTFIIDYQGNIVDSYYLDNVDRENIVFYESEHSFGISSTSNEGDISINNTTISLGYQNALYDIQASSTNVLNTIRISENLKIHKVGRDNITHEPFYLVSKKILGGIDVTIDNITIKDNEIYLLAFTNNSTIKWSKRLSFTNIDPNYIDFIVGQYNNSLYLSATFTNQLTFDNIVLNSNGGKDIFIVKLTSDGRIIGHKHYGTNDDETVSKIYNNYSQLLFGGEISGQKIEREIGETYFIYTSLAAQTAYMSHISDYNFKTEKTGGKIAKTNNINVPLSVEVVPNPFNESLLVSIHCIEKCNFEVRLVDILGRTRWYRKEANLSSFEIENASKLEAGIYFLEVKGDNGTQIIKRLVKQ